MVPVTALIWRDAWSRRDNLSSLGAIYLRRKKDVEAERAARSGALTQRKCATGEIRCSEVRGKSVLEVLRLLKSMVDTIA